MAKSKSLLCTLFIPLTFTLLFSSLVIAEPGSYSRRISPTSLGFHDEKLTHLHFYFHDVVTGQKPTMLIVVEPNGRPKDSLPFGTMVIIDDPLTLGPEQDSELVGKAQGLYTSASKEEMALVMVMTFAFTTGEYNGSTLSVLGRNMIDYPVREMPIIGGTGAFRFASGFARTNFFSVDFTKGDAIVEYNVYVKHYVTPDSSPEKKDSSPESFREGLEFMADPMLGKRSIN